MREALVEAVGVSKAEAVPEAAGEAVAVAGGDREPLAKPVVEPHVVGVAVRRAEGEKEADSEKEEEAVNEPTAVDEGETVREACAVAQCVADCDGEPDADAPPCDAVRLAPSPSEPVPEADAEVVRVAEGDAPPVGEPPGGAVGAGQGDGEEDCEFESESAMEKVKDAVPHEEAGALGDAALEGDAEGGSVADGVIRSEGVAVPADAHCVVEEDTVALEVAQAVEVRVAPFAWIDAVAESSPGMEGDMEGDADMEAVREAEGEGVAITRRAMVCAPLSTTYATFEMGSR